MDYKTITTAVKMVDDRTVIGYPAITGNIDSGGDRIFKGAFKKTIKENLGRVKHLWQHNFMDPPTAKIMDLKEVTADDLPIDILREFPEATGGLELTREYLRSARADEILEGIKNGVITEMSFGYDPVKWDYEELEDKGASPFGIVRNLRELRLWDTSDVNWGMNPATVASKLTVPFEDTGVADLEEAWKTPELKDFTGRDFHELPDPEKARIKKHFALGSDDSFESLLMPHHLPSKTGVGPACYEGVVAAMQALIKAPLTDESSFSETYRHLAAHYKQFGKEPLDLKVVQMSHSVAVVGDIEPLLTKAGRVLSKRNMEKLKEALAVLTDILLSAEPSDAEDDSEKARALTESVLRRLAIMERDPIMFVNVGDKK